MMMFEMTYNLVTLPAAIPSILDVLGDTDIVALMGDLGAGKTTLVGYIAAHLGVTDEVSSPTFALINDYELKGHAKYNRILHSDWYRIDDENEAIDAGIEDMLEDRKALKFVEWPSKAEGLLPKSTLLVNIETLSETERKMTIQPYFG